MPRRIGEATVTAARLGGLAHHWQASLRGERPLPEKLEAQRGSQPFQGYQEGEIAAGRLGKRPRKSDVESRILPAQQTLA
eukprot:12449369-Alexandrium_andersonii.AAC.1